MQTPLTVLVGYTDLLATLPAAKILTLNPGELARCLI